MTSFNVPLLASAALLPPPTLRFDGVALRDSLGEGGAEGVRVRNFESGT